jgi:acetyl-CoA acetyltransferase
VRDVAVVAFAQAPLEQEPGATDALMLLPVITEALDSVGLTRRDVDFTCSGSADYLIGGAFTFVQALEAAGAWPPISESHVEMDGAWALYEAWVRLQHGDVDVALAYSSSRATASDLRRTLTLQLDPYYLSPLGVDHVSLAALQAQAVLDATGTSERELAEVAARSRAAATDNPYAATKGAANVDELLAAEHVVAPLRPHDIAPTVDGAAAVVLVAGDRARELCERPAWIRGIDHRIDPQYPGARDLADAASARVAAREAGVDGGAVDVAELCATFTHEELLLRDALGLKNGADVNPSGGALCANPLMVTGLVRIGEVARRIHAGEATLGVSHAASGPCLQQNLVCVMEGRG